MRFTELPERDRKVLVRSLFEKFKYIPQDDIYRELSFNNPEVILSGEAYTISADDLELLEGWLNFGGI